MMMPLTLVTGPEGSGLADVSQEFLADAADRGLRPVLLLPSGSDVDIARACLERVIPVGATAATPTAFLTGLWRAWGDGRRVINATQREQLLADVVADRDERPGLTRVLEDLAEHAACASGEEWRRRVRGPRDEGVLLDLLQRYSAELETRGLVEVAETVAPLLGSGALDGHAIALAGITNPSPLERRLVLTLAESEIPVMVTMVWIPGRAATAALGDFVALLAHAGEHRHLQSGIGNDPENDLTRIRAELFEQPEPRPPDGTVRFLSAEGGEAEADLIVAEIQGLQEEGFRPEDIVVVFRDPVAALGPLRTALGESGISANYDLIVPFPRTPFGRAAQGIIDFVASGERRALLSWIRSGFCTSNGAAATELERRWRATGERRPAALLGGLRALGDWQYDEVRAIKAAKGSVSATAWARLFERMMLERYGPEPAVTDAVSLDADAHEAMRTLLDSLHELGKEYVTAPALSRGGRRLRVALGTDRPSGRIRVTTPERMIAGANPVVIVAGVEPGRFPKKRQSLLASGEARAALHALGITAGLESPELAERMLFYRVVMSAQDRLLVCRRRTDSAGGALGNSIYWEQLRDFYRAPTEDAAQDTEIEGIERFLAMDVLTRGEHESMGVRQLLRRSVVRACAGSTATTHERVRRAGERSRTRRRGLNQPMMLEALAARTSFSVSELELYARCPYRWFVERVVRPESLDDERAPLERGAFIHKALSLFYPALRADGHPRMTQDLLAELPARIDAAIAEAIETEPIPESERAEFARFARAGMFRLLSHDAELLPGFVFDAAEVALVEGDELGAGMDGYRLTGRIDRLDRDRDGALVITDYKSGSVDGCTTAKLEEHCSLQVPLYAAVLRSRGERVVGAFYRSVSKDPRPRGPFCGECGGPGLFANDRVDDMDAITDWAIRTADAAVAGIRRGDITQKPVSGACDFCPAADFCEQEVFVDAGADE